MEVYYNTTSRTVSCQWTKYSGSASFEQVRDLMAEVESHTPFKHRNTLFMEFDNYYYSAGYIRLMDQEELERYGLDGNNE